MEKPCAVDSCPALAAPPSDFCPGHTTAKRLQFMLTDQKCSRCQRKLHAGDYVTIDSTLEYSTHAQCPPPVPLAVKRGVQPTPLFDETR